MAPTWIETDTNANKDISAAVSVGVYTSTGDKFIMPQLLADQVAGGGDYVYYVTLQVNGAGSAYVIGPKTTHTAAAGETAIGAQGGFIAVRSGDVLTVYVDGLAGDTATPDVTVRWFELDASANVTKILGVDAPDLSGLDGLDGSTLALEDTAQAILEDTGTTLPAAIEAIEPGGGSYAGDGTGYYTDTVEADGNPLDGVRVQLYTAPNRVGPAYEAYTNALGVFEMWPDPGVYYRWLDLAGYNFTQDVAVTVTEP